MRRTILTIVFGVFMAGYVFAQKGAPAFYVSDRGGVCDTVYNKLDVASSYPGGVNEMYYFFNRTLDAKYANLLHPNITSKRIMVKLLVSDAGKIVDRKVLLSISKDYDDAVLQAIEKFPALIPGKVKGANVCSYYIVALNFLK
ncbi:MAG: hypothetical protein WCU80_06925 [Paludibacteraceae bacterium]